MPGITNPEFSREERLDADTLRVTRQSSFSDEVHTLDLRIDEAEWETFLAGRELIQDALPRLTNAEREFLLTGSTQGEWDAVFSGDDDEAEQGKDA